MKIIKSSLYSAILLSFLFLTACGGTTDPSEAYKGETSDQIFQDGEKALVDRNYSEAIKHFEALDVQYPFDRNTEIAQFHVIYAYYMNSDYTSAEASADRFIHSHPTNPHIDYAYYMRGLSDFYQNLGVFERIFNVDYSTRDLTQVKKSYNDFAELTARFPDSRYAPAAHQYMIYLRNVLATHQLEVAEFYFNHAAYVGAVNRAAGVVQHYQGSPNVPDALVLMAKSYHNLHETELENQIIHVLVYNYPNSQYVEEVTGPKADSKKFALVPRPEQAIPPPAEEEVLPPRPIPVAHHYTVHKPSEAVVQQRVTAEPVVVPQHKVAPVARPAQPVVKVEPVVAPAPAVVVVKPAPKATHKPVVKPAPKSMKVPASQPAPTSAAPSANQAEQNTTSTNGDRSGSGSIKLGDAIDKITASDFFHLSPKKNPEAAKPQAPAPAQPATPPKQPAKKKHKQVKDNEESQDEDSQSHQTLRNQKAIALIAQPGSDTNLVAKQYPSWPDNGQRR